MSRKGIEAFIYVLACVLLIIRVDFWWWGTKIQPIIAGWLTIPMLYQLFIWAAGVVLVYIVCLVVWKDEPQKGGK
jgi:hypothetical protein